MTTNETMNAVNEIDQQERRAHDQPGRAQRAHLRELAARQMDAMNLSMDHGMRLMKLATESKGYNEFFKGQVEATKELSERVMAESKTNMQLAGEARDDYRAWFEKNLAEVSADLRKACRDRLRSGDQHPCGPGRDCHFQRASGSDRHCKWGQGSPQLVVRPSGGLMNFKTTQRPGGERHGTYCTGHRRHRRYRYRDLHPSGE